MFKLRFVVMEAVCGSIRGSSRQEQMLNHMSSPFRVRLRDILFICVPVVVKQFGLGISDTQLLVLIKQGHLIKSQKLK